MLITIYQVFAISTGIYQYLYVTKPELKSRLFLVMHENRLKIFMNSQCKNRDDHVVTVESLCITMLQKVTRGIQTNGRSYAYNFRKIHQH